jgi:beta-lactam-binding protein with PASTA domain
MPDGSEHRGYETPIMGDVETAYRRLFRFQVKFMLVVVAIILVVGGVVAGVVLTRHSEPATVPDVRGLDNVAVASSFDRAGLASDYQRFERADETVTFGRVLTTDPPPGARVKRGTVVSVTFSCGMPQPGFCSP